ncbi:hypothetical protein BYT27DRAFT_7194962 [Phlegmacium glaucopus]|nr:hypothetical protein BYT27DRAFT_7194962 [Phlegmacium glaucopus]
MHLPESDSELEDAQRDGDMSVYHIVRRMHTVQVGEGSLPIQSNGVIGPPTPTPTCRPALHYNVGYPAHILEISRQCQSYSLTDSTVFCPLWRLVLAYWFPPSQGYSLVGDLEFMDLQRGNICVLFQEQPFLLLQIHGVTDIHSGVTRRTLKERANKLFDTGAVWSGHTALCVISAVGTRWNGFIRSTDMTSEMAQRVLIDDWFGGWSENVSSQASHEALSLFFGSLKSSFKYDAYNVGCLYVNN